METSVVRGRPPSRKAPNPAKPNTGVRTGMLSKETILCCGEDAVELLSAFQGWTPQEEWVYRCYRVWKFTRFTLIWTGIGTGCLEPLLFEILQPSSIKSLILIGTAGALSDRMRTGQPYLLSLAELGPTAITPHVPPLPLVPNWPSAQLRHLAPATIISTDYYYGFTRHPNSFSRRLIVADANLSNAIPKLAQADLIDMETAQFYHFCRALRGQTLRFLALKGPANPAADPFQQTLHSRPLLHRLATLSLSLLL